MRRRFFWSRTSWTRERWARRSDGFTYRPGPGGPWATWLHQPGTWLGLQVGLRDRVGGSTDTYRSRRRVGSRRSLLRRRTFLWTCGDVLGSLASFATNPSRRRDNGSKWGYTYTADWKVAADKHEVKDHSIATLRRQISESKAMLGDHLNLYQIHSATLESGVLGNTEVLDELACLRAGGLKIGLTLAGPNQSSVLRLALEVTVDGKRLFDCVQATWNLLEPSAGSALQMAHDVGLDVIVKEALANGRLTERNNDQGFAPKRQILASIAARLHTSLDALALAAVLAQPWADVVLSGAASPDQLRSNLFAQSMQRDQLANRQFGEILALAYLDLWSIRPP
jgi:aryl-alcohol dehydrogenase-like predicted oxidoreductase